MALGNDLQNELHRFRGRVFVAVAVVAVLFLILVV
jgi:hypothetical protein